MNEEIKEIFYKLRSDDYYEKHYQQSVYYEKDLIKLENYITNLQKENEKLKEENKHIFSRVNDDELLISNAMNYAELQDYKSRNEKAVEYIKEWWYEKNTRDINRIVSLGDKRIDLLNILQGENDD